MSDCLRNDYCTGRFHVTTGGAVAMVDSNFLCVQLVLDFAAAPTTVRPSDHQRIMWIRQPNKFMCTRVGSQWGHISSCHTFVSRAVERATRTSVNPGLDFLHSRNILAPSNIPLSRLCSSLFRSRSLLRQHQLPRSAGNG
jgi:hypothetical protein